MGKLTLTGLVKSLSGRVGNVVARRTPAGALILGDRPAKRPGPGSDPQQLQRKQFTAAAKYAKDVMGNPAKRAFYDALAAATKKNIFALIVADYLSPPEIDKVDLSGYHGHVGDPIVVSGVSSRHGQITGVAVEIKDHTGASLESGQAVLAGETWVYHATTALPAGETAPTIIATATDQVGHTSNRGAILGQS